MRKGFTLIEVLVYTAIIGMVVVAFISLSLSISNGRVKTHTAQEVQANARMALKLITQKVRSAESVDIPASVFDVDPGVLSLRQGGVATVFKLDQDNGMLELIEGGGPAVAVTSKEVSVSALIFRNFTGANQRESLGVEITIAYRAPSGDARYNFSQSLKTSVSVRR